MEDHPQIVKPVILDEMYYKEMLRRAKIRILPHKDYEPLLKAVNLVGIKNGTLEFFVKSRYNGWHTYLQFPEWNNEVKDMSMTAPEVARLLLAGDHIKLSCDCPSYCFHGYQYIETQYDAAIVPEHRFPHVRNPQLLGFGCKHIRKMLTVAAFYLGDMAKEIKQQRVNLKLI